MDQLTGLKTVPNDKKGPPQRTGAGLEAEPDGSTPMDGNGA